MNQKSLKEEKFLKQYRIETTIYYSTGTGNSLKAAKDLYEKLTSCDLVPIAKVWEMEDLLSTSEKVGFFFPLYYSGLPKIVLDFLKELDVNKSNNTQGNHQSEKIILIDFT
jgi:hypothetical protein